MSTFSDVFFSPSFKRKPTILQVIPALGNGGVEIETIEIAKAIRNAGGRSLIAAGGGEQLENPLPESVELKNLPLNTKNPFQISKNSHHLKKLIKDEKVDIVHVRSRAPAWSAYKATRSLDVPFLTTYHAAYKSKTILKTFYNSIMARGDKVIAISQFIKDHIIERYNKFEWFDPSNIRLIQRGIDLHYFDPSVIMQARLDHLRMSWGISPQARLLLLPGRISRQKGQDLLVKAISLMKRADVTAVFLGSAQGHETFRDSLFQLAASLDIEGRIKWMPPCPDVPAAYQLADVIVCPSLVPEGFGRIMAEAQAMEKPIIASNHGAAQEVIEDGVTGWLTPMGDPNTLAQALDHVLNLPQEHLREMGRRGRERAKTYFSKEAMAAKTITVYKELLGDL